MGKEVSVIRADQIPDEVEEAAWNASGDDMKAAIAAALSAWPRWKGCWDEDETGLHRCLLLPLPQKDGDA
jgi:hypothetical protein